MTENARKAVITKVKKGREKGQFRFTLFGDNGESVGNSGKENYHNLNDIVATLTKYFPSFTIVKN